MKKNEIDKIQNMHNLLGSSLVSVACGSRSSQSSTFSRKDEDPECVVVKNRINSDAR